MSRSTFSSRSSGTPFQRLLQQHCQKVSASKSAGVVGKWGSASFTSIRRAAHNPVVSNGSGGSRPNKFFKSRSTTSPVETDDKSEEPKAEKRQTLKRPSVKAAVAASSNDDVEDGDVHVEETVKRSRTSTTNKFFVSRKNAKDDDSKTVPPLRLKVRSPPKNKGQFLTALRDEEAIEQRVDISLVASQKGKKRSNHYQDPREDDDRMHQKKDEDTDLKYVKSSCKNDVLDVTQQKSSESDEELKTPLDDVVPDHQVELPNEEPACDAREDEVIGITSEEESDTQPFETQTTEEDDDCKIVDSIERDCGNLNDGDSISMVSEVHKAATVAACNDYSRSSKDEGEQLACSSLQSTEDLQTTNEFAQPSVPRRRFIFKSKSESSGQSSNKKALYKHKWTAHGDEREQFKQEVFQRAVLGKPSQKPTGFDFDDDPGAEDSLAPAEMSFASSKLTRVQANDPNITSTEIMSVKCPKAQRDYFTVVKNVKKAHQIQDSGEFQEFNDDVEYILGGLGSINNLSTRCLSAITLATKCMEPSFRMHLRAHGTVTKFFAELKDAPDNPSLALCAATVLFVLSQDRLNMDLDRDSLELMLNLLDTESKIKDALETAGLNNRELVKNKQKVLDLVAEMKAKGHASSLSLEHISADHLSMETLLSLTSKRAGEWFKEELRDLGGLDHLVRTLSECVYFLTSEEINLWTEPLLEKLKKAGRVLKVLENVSHENEENCNYLLKTCRTSIGEEKREFLDLIVAVLKLVCEEIPLNAHNDEDKDGVGSTLRETFFDVIRVLINVVHDYHQLPLGSAMAGQRGVVFELALQCIFTLPPSLPTEKRFDVAVLALTIIVNLVENCVQNRIRLMQCQVPESADELGTSLERENAVQGLIRLFIEKEESARTEETTTDTLIDGMNVKSEEGQSEEKTKEERIDETVAKLLHKAGRHMEDTLVASYISLIIGYIIKDDKEREREVRALLPSQRFDTMVAVLKKFFNFMRLTASSLLANSRGLKATEMILRHLQDLDAEEAQPREHEETEDQISLADCSLVSSNATCDQTTWIKTEED